MKEFLNHKSLWWLKIITIEAINLIKEITPGLEDTESQDSTSRKDRTSRSTIDKPWKSKKNKMKKDEPSSISVYSNKDIQKDNPEKKISSATRKRLEAQTVAKQAQKLSRPNLS